MNGLFARLRQLWAALSRLPMTMILASALAGLGIIQMAFLLGNGIYRYHTWRQQTVQVSRQRDELRQQVGVLQAVKSRANDAEYLTGLARCLGYVQPDETVLVASGAREQQGEVPSGNCETVRLP